MRPNQQEQSRLRIQIIVTLALVATLVVIAETTGALWLYYVVFAVLALNLLLSWLQARRR
jgi:hypothetical protein